MTTGEYLKRELGAVNLLPPAHKDNLQRVSEGRVSKALSLVRYRANERVVTGQRLFQLPPEQLECPA